jgi:hypothetical protein
MRDCKICLEFLERLEGWWRGKAQARLDHARDLGIYSPHADEHLRLAAEYEQKADECRKASPLIPSVAPAPALRRIA